MSFFHVKGGEISGGSPFDPDGSFRAIAAGPAFVKARLLEKGGGKGKAAPP
jgi:hypothetical protein